MFKMNSPGWGESPPGDPKNAHRRGGLYTHYTNPLGLTFAMGFPPRPPIKKNGASHSTRPPSSWLPLAPLDHHRHGCLSLHSTTRVMNASRSTQPQKRTAEPKPYCPTDAKQFFTYKYRRVCKFSCAPQTLHETSGSAFFAVQTAPHTEHPYKISLLTPATISLINFSDFSITY